MAQVSIGDPHGLYRVFVGLVSTEGYNIGTTTGPALPAEETQVTPYEMKYAQSAEISMPERTVIDFTGGDVWTGSFVYGITSLGTFQLVSSTIEGELIALLSASGIDTTQNTRVAAFAENIMLASPPQAWLMTVFRLQSKAAGSVGANKYLTIVLPRVWVAPQGISGAPTFQGAGTFGFTIVPTIGDRMPWGPLFSSTTLNFANDDTSPNFYLITDNPIHTTGYVALAAEADESITLPYLPISGYDYSSPDSSTDPVQCYIDGTQTNATSVTQATGVVVVPSGGTFTGGEFIGILYETAYATAA